MRGVWVTWENQRRNHTVSSALKVPLHIVRASASRFWRYPRLLLRTIQLLRSNKLEVLFVQNPSLVLALFAVYYGKLSGMPVVVDAHNGGIFPLEGKSQVLNGIARHIIRRAWLTLVTNGHLKQFVDKTGGNGYVLPDPFPDLPSLKEKSTAIEGKYAVFICTYAKDEPYLEVVKAARRLGDGVTIFITGKIKAGVEREIGVAPQNVVLTGYLDEGEYLKLLHGADVVIDLTTREDCLVCGAYEAVAMGIPLIVSGTRALMQYFNRGVLYTDNTEIDLAAKIQEAFSKKEALQCEIAQLRSARSEEWVVLRDRLLQIIEEKVIEDKGETLS